LLIGGHGCFGVEGFFTREKQKEISEPQQLPSETDVHQQGTFRLLGIILRKK
jgi:hypothetical protein